MSDKTQQPDPTPAFQRLFEIVKTLRGPQGCPWDKEQTQVSLTRYILEEAFELVEAIDSQNQIHIKEELGDFLFQVILQAQVAADQGSFALKDVLEVLNEKMIRRHPHVFAGAEHQVDSAQEVVAKWQKIKAAEKPGEQNQIPDRLVKELRGYPALLTAYKIGLRSGDWKFDWDTAAQVKGKVEEELAEVEEAIASGDPAAQEDEIGDLLFAVSQWARHLKIDPEAALRKANLKFERRFHTMLKLAGLTQETFRDLPLTAKEDFWAQAKRAVKDQFEASARDRNLS